MSPVAGQLVGRERELAMLELSLDRLDAGSAGVVQVVGEPGIGKTSLLTEVVERARRRGYLALVGRAAEFERELPFGVVLDALNDHLTSLDPGTLEQLDSKRLHELGAVFPSIASLAQQRPVGPQTERYRSYRAVRSLLEQLAAERPLVLALDDLHWADPASIELISHLLRRLPQSPVLLPLAFRPRQVPPEFETALEAALREEGGEAIQLAPLTAEQSDELLGGGMERALRRRIHEESGGNPFYLEQLARTARASAGMPRVDEDLGDYGVPRAVAASIIDELNALSTQAQTVLQAAAVVGERFEPDLAAQAAEVGEVDALSAFDESLGFDLIRPTAAPRRFRFRHPIVRRAVYESAEDDWRRAAHGRAAAALAGRGAPAAARAHHVERSAGVGDEAAIALLTDAGHAAASRAPAAAADWFGAALRLVPEGDDDVQHRLELLTPMAIALGSAGRLEESRDALREVLDLLPGDVTALRVRAVVFSAVVDHMLGNHDKGQRLLLKTLSELPDPGSLEATKLKGELAFGCFFGADWQGMQSWAREALEASVSERGLNAVAAGALALGQYGAGKVQRAEASVAEAADLLDGLADDELATRLQAVPIIGWVEHCIEHVDQSIRHSDRGVAVSRATGQWHLVVAMLAVQGMGLVWQGRLQEATDIADEAVESSLLSPNPLFLTAALTLRCALEIYRGDLGAARRFGDQAAATGASTRSPWSAAAGWYRAEAWLESGQVERCRNHLLTVASDPELAFPLFSTRSCELLVRAELARGRLEAADDWATQAESAAEQLGLKRHAAEAHRARAAVLLARGNPSQAARAALASVSAAEHAGARVEAARSRTLAGRALARGGERDRAVAQLEQAEAELGACGAFGYRDRAARELRRLGRRVPRSGQRGQVAAGVEALSAREREVAKLVRAGKTNREIAQGLVLSEKTIERHLSHIFSKLGVTSRGEVAAEIERAGETAAA